MQLASLVPAADEFLVLHKDFQLDMARNIALLREGQAAAPSMAADGLALEDLAQRALQSCLPFQAALAALQPVFSHNDLVSGNVLAIPNGSVLAIDFETASLTGLDFCLRPDDCGRRSRLDAGWPC